LQPALLYFCRLTGHLHFLPQEFRKAATFCTTLSADMDENKINIALMNAKVERATANLQLHSGRNPKLWMKFDFRTP